MMLKSLKSCKRELKVLASAVGMVRIEVAMNYIITTKAMLISTLDIEVFMNYMIDPKSINSICMVLFEVFMNYAIDSKCF